MSKQAEIFEGNKEYKIVLKAGEADIAEAAKGLEAMVEGNILIVPKDQLMPIVGRFALKGYEIINAGRYKPEIAAQEPAESADETVRALDRDSLVEELVTNPKFFHYCYGKAVTREWTPRRGPGDLLYHPDIVLEPVGGHTNILNDRTKIGYYNEMRAKYKETKAEADRLQGVLRQLEEQLASTSVFRTKSRRELKSKIAEAQEKYKAKRRESSGYCSATTGSEVAKRSMILLDCYEDLWDGKINKNEHDFEAKVLEHTAGRSVVIAMYYMDHTHDNNRANPSVTYAIAIPLGRTADVKPMIKEDPTILIDAFRKAFPNYDNSKGTLKIIESRL